MAEIRPHRCDERCVCREHEEPVPLIYWSKGGQHACQDPDCKNAHGMTVMLPWGFEIAI